MKLSPRYTEKQWNAAFDGPEDWDTGIDIVEDRIKGRWLDAADRLLGESQSGFAILTLDCIVLESLWGFMNGQAVPRRGEKFELCPSEITQLAAEMFLPISDCPNQMTNWPRPNWQPRSFRR